MLKYFDQDIDPKDCKVKCDVCANRQNVNYFEKQNLDESEDVSNLLKAMNLNEADGPQEE